MYTDRMRMTGLSGIDTESMVQQLMKAEGMRMTSLKQVRQLTEWRQEAYRNTAKTLQTFKTNYLNLSTASSVRLNANFNNFTTTVRASAGKTDNDLTVKFTSEMRNNGFSLNVKQLAQKDLYTASESLASSAKAQESLNFSSIAAGTSIEMNIDGGKYSTITFDRTYTSQADFLADLNTKLKNTFKTDKTPDPGNPSGSEIDVAKVTADVVDGKLVISGRDGHSVVVKAPAENSGLASIGFTAATSSKLDTTKTLSELFPSSFDPNGSVSFDINGKTFTFDRTDSLKKMMETVNAEGTGVKMGLDSLTGKVTMESADTGARSALTFDDSANNFLTNALKFNLTAPRDASAKAQDALFDFNGTSTSRESNNFTIDGAIISLGKNSLGGSYEISAAKNVNDTVGMIKKFVDEYNTLIKDLNKQFTTTRPKSGSYSYYEPLSEEERSAMSDKDIERWEEKAKTGLLYRDDILSSLASEFRSMITDSVELENGTRLSLADIGITTTRNDGSIGTLVIDEAKLTKNLTERGDDVRQLFTKSSDMSGLTPANRKARMRDEGIGDRLDDIIRNAIEGDGSIYKKAGIEQTSSDKNNLITKMLKEQDDKIAAMLKTLQNKENNYYAMFSRLENAMNQSNSQMASLQGMLGM